MACDYSNQRKRSYGWRDPSAARRIQYLEHTKGKKAQGQLATFYLLDECLHLLHQVCTNQ